MSSSSFSAAAAKPNPSSTTTKRLLHELQLYSTTSKQGKPKGKGRAANDHTTSITLHDHDQLERRQGNDTEREQTSEEERGQDNVEQQEKAEEDEEDQIFDHLAPVSEDDLMHWTAILKGPKMTAYESGRWRLDVKIPTNYPLAPPDVRFVTRVCHANVNFKVPF